MNVVCYEQGLLRTWSFMNEVEYGRGLICMQSVVNVV